MFEDKLKYETMTVNAMRGTERRSIDKWQGQGWELVDQATGTVRTTLTFRRPRPPVPWRKMAWLGAAVGVLALIVTLGALLEDDDEEPAAADPAASASKSPAPTKQTEAHVTETTVDELLDRLNSGDAVEVGDRFAIEGELFESDAWGTGASGDYFVMLKAKKGADDLPVFVEESDAATWQDGTKVQMVVEAAEATIDGETTDGWLKALSVRTLSGDTSAAAKEQKARAMTVMTLRTYASMVNEAAGETVIDEISPGDRDGVLEVRLNPRLASASPLELKTVIRTMNKQIVDVAADGPDHPDVRYFLAGDLVARNRALLDAWDVKFDGLLSD